MIERDKFREDRFLARWIAGQLSDQESCEFTEWLEIHHEEKSFFEELRQVWRRYENLSLKPGWLKEARWQRIREKANLATELDGQTSTRTVFYRMAAAAAAVIVIAGGYFL